MRNFFQMILSSQLLIPVRRALRKSAMWGMKGPGQESIPLLPSKLVRNFSSKPEQSKYFRMLKHVCFEKFRKIIQILILRSCVSRKTAFIQLSSTIVFQRISTRARLEENKRNHQAIWSSLVHHLLGVSNFLKISHSPKPMLELLCHCSWSSRFRSDSGWRLFRG